MSKYCVKCGEEISENADFCGKCGTPIKAKKPNNVKFFVIGIAVLLIILGAFFALNFEPRPIPVLKFEADSTIYTADEMAVTFEGSSSNVSDKILEITFKNDDNSYDFKAFTDEDGVASVDLDDIEEGTYNITARFSGDNDYAPSSSTTSKAVKDTATTVGDTEVSTEPDYESYPVPVSFADTDLNGDGYVTLDDMNIAHTPQNIINQMYSDSDDNGDMLLNEHEYYKFMYKLNHDYESYGISR